jgi:ubiquinone biosynthesis O-methyltransferase
MSSLATRTFGKGSHSSLISSFSSFSPRICHACERLPLPSTPRVHRNSRQWRKFSGSVSSTEVDKFSSLNDEWWDARKNPLIHMNAVRIQYIQNVVERHAHSADGSSSRNRRSPLDGLEVLDIGCGGGLACESLARLGASVTGVDPSDSLIRAAKAHGQLDPQTQSINYIGGYTAEQLALQQPEKFDVICLLEVVEHATNAPSLLHATAQLLKPNGLLFVSTINRTAKSYLLTILGAEYVMRYIPVGTHDWSKYLSPQEVNSLAAEALLQNIDVSGMVLSRPPLFGNWDWKLDRSDLDVNWIGSYVKRNHNA